MQVGPAIFQGVLAVATLVSGALTWFAWRRREVRGARYVVVFLAGATLWTGAELAFVAVESAGLRLLFLKLIYVGVAVVAPSWFAYILVYTGRGRLVTRRTLALLGVVPAVMVVAMFTNGAHGLMFETLHLAADISGSEVEPGPVFWLEVAYGTTLMGTTALLLLDTFVRVERYYRRQVALLLVGALAPEIATLLFVFQVVRLDPAPVGYLVSGIALSVAISREGLLDVLPVAKDEVLETLDAGVVVVDRDGRVVLANRRAGRMLGTDGSALTGRSVDDLLPDRPAAAERLREMVRADVEEVEVDLEPGGRTITVRQSPLRDHRGRFLARVFLATDVTEQKRRERELERRNEQLDQFASLLSHDLRNPLNVAFGMLDGARETGDGEFFDHTEQALGRMSELIDDALALTRSGRPVAEEDRTTIPIREVAEDAWDTVETGDATLVVDGDLRVSAEPGRLRRAFENLHRNAVEHGGPEVEVRVGPLSGSDAGPAGFYVEDDGPGIPEDERQRVFDGGYSGDDDGTGLGLAIVGAAIEAHDWEIDVTRGDHGGARFEVTGLSGSAVPPGGTRPASRDDGSTGVPSR